MATLAEPALNGESASAAEPGGWGLILIPILLCLGMLVFALASQARPAQEPTPISRACVSSYEPRPATDC